MSALPDLTSVRARIGAVLVAEGKGDSPRDVVVLAVDGVGYAQAAACWTTADITSLESVFPTVSATAWLSSTTGQSVDDHGVPGVYFTVDDDAPRSFLDRSVLPGPEAGTLFTDAAAASYEPVVLLGDLQHYPGAWRDRLIAGARAVTTPPLFTAAGGRPLGTAPNAVSAALLAAVDAQRTHRRSPLLLWCYLELDTHVHFAGFDGYAEEVVAALGRAAEFLADQGAVVIAYADHGLTRTEHDPGLAAALTRLCAERSYRLGGAGRTRWLYCGDPPAEAAEVVENVLAPWQEHVALEPADQSFAPGSLARSRVGDLLLVAQGERFLALPGHRYDHGSRLRDEMLVPFATWG